MFLPLYIDDTQNLFNLGSKGTEEEQADKKKGANDIGEDRLADTLAMKDGAKRDAKRERVNHAVNLRQKKREELQKRRRGFPDSTAQPDIDFKSMTIDQALAYAKTSGMALEAFINTIANQMKF